MREFTVTGLAMDSATNAPVVLLRELDGERILPIWIGPAEANAIAVRLADLETPRPLTHDLMTRLLDGAGLNVERVVISDIKDHTYFAELVLEGTGRIVKIDARPSDCIALALRAEAPIYISDTVYLAEFGSDPDDAYDRFERLRQRLRRTEPGEFGNVTL